MVDGTASMLGEPARAEEPAAVPLAPPRRFRLFSLATLQGAVFVCLAAYFLALYIMPAIRQYNIFYLQVFDYGIIYNSTQEIAYLRPLFMTTRGVHAWGDSQDYFQILFAPLHYLPQPHYWLIAAHSIGIWACGVFCFFYLRPYRLVALLIPLVVWMSPHLMNSSQDLFHTESYATILHLLVFWAAVTGRRTLFVVSVLLVLSCKEDLAITVAWFMLLALLRPSLFRIERRYLVGALVASVLVFGVNQVVVQPYYKLRTCEWLGTPVGRTRIETTPSPWFANIWVDLLRPAFYVERLGQPGVTTYLLMLFWPVALFLRASFPLILLPLAPAAINVIGSNYLIKTYFHYDHSTYAAIIIIMLLGLSRMRWKTFVALVLFGIALWINLKSPVMRVRLTWLFPPYNVWSMDKDERTVFSERLNGLLPSDVVVSADYGTLNYLLKGRSQAFMFENPYRPDYFGVYGVCDGNGRPLPGLPPADLVVLRADYRPTATGEAHLKPLAHYKVMLFRGSFPMNMYINPDSPRREVLESVMNELGAKFVAPKPAS